MLIFDNGSDHYSDADNKDFPELEHMKQYHEKVGEMAMDVGAELGVLTLVRADEHVVEIIAASNGDGDVDKVPAFLRAASVALSKAADDLAQKIKDGITPDTSPGGVVLSRIAANKMPGKFKPNPNSSN